MIVSLSNQRIKSVALLQEKAQVRRSEGLFVAEGVKMFLEAPVNQLVEVFISEHFFSTIRDGCQEKKVREKLEQCGWEEVSAEVFKKMADTQTPQGILCVLRQNVYQLESMLNSSEPALFLLLEDIQDPGNLGTMIRTAEGAGVSGIIASRATVDMYNPKTIRATMGSVYRVPFYYAEDLETVAREMRKQQITIYAAHLLGEKDYDLMEYKSGSAFLIGNEARGLSEHLAICADAYVKIPMKGNVESLNASVAAALLMYEAARQRR